MNIFYESSYNGLIIISVATQRAIKLVSWIWIFGFLPRGWNRICWKFNGPMVVFYRLYNIILLLSLMATFSALIWRAWGTEPDGGLDFSIQGTGTVFVTFAVALSI